MGNRKVYLSNIIREHGASHADTRLDGGADWFEWVVVAYVRGVPKTITVCRDVDLIDDSYSVVFIAGNPKCPADVVHSGLTRDDAEARCDALNRETRGALGRYAVRHA